MVLLLAVFILQEAPKPLPTIDVADTNDRARVLAVHDTLERLSEKVTACVTAGGKTETCRCSDPADLASLRKGYDTLVMQNLRRQRETLKCD